MRYVGLKYVEIGSGIGDRIRDRGSDRGEGEFKDQPRLINFTVYPVAALYPVYTCHSDLV